MVWVCNEGMCVPVLGPSCSVGPRQNKSVSLATHRRAEYFVMHVRKDAARAASALRAPLSVWRNTITFVWQVQPGSWFGDEGRDILHENSTGMFSRAAQSTAADPSLERADTAL